MEAAAIDSAEYNSATQAANGATTDIDLTPLSFTELNRRLELWPDYDTGHAQRPRLAQWGLVLVIAGGAIALGTQYPGIPALPKLIALSAGFVTEVLGLGLHFWYGFRHELRNSMTPRRDFAAMLDFDMSIHFSLIDWLKRQPEDVLKQHYQLAKFRRERMTQKLPMLTGNLQALGILPLAIALFLQIQQLVAGTHIGMPSMVAGIFLVCIYIGSWSATIVKQRLDAMEMLLEAATLEKLPPGPSP